MSMAEDELYIGQLRQEMVVSIEKYLGDHSLPGLSQPVADALAAVSRHHYLPPDVPLEAAYEVGHSILLNRAAADEAFNKWYQQIDLNRQARFDILQRHAANNPIMGAVADFIYEQAVGNASATASDPIIVSQMLNASLPGKVGIEMGTGGGYVVALMEQTEQWDKVIGVEVDKGLAVKAVAQLQQDGYGVTIINADAIDWISHEGKKEGLLDAALVSFGMHPNFIEDTLEPRVAVGGSLVAPQYARQYEFPNMFDQFGHGVSRDVKKILTDFGIPTDAPEYDIMQIVPGWWRTKRTIIAPGTVFVGMK